MPRARHPVKLTIMAKITFDPEHPLDRCAGETRRANDALRDYYQMGAGRSLRRLRDLYREKFEGEGDSIKPPTRNFKTLIVWSTDDAWQARVDAQLRIDRAAEEAARSDALRAQSAAWAERRMQVRERDWEQAEKLRKLADAILEESPRFLKTSRKYIPPKNGDPEREIITIAIDAKLMVNSLETASKLQRLAAEMETEHTLEEQVSAESIEEVRAKRWADIQAALQDALNITAGGGEQVDDA